VNQNSIFPESLNKLKNNPLIVRKLKIILGVTFIGFLLVFALVIWGGVVAVRGVANLGTNANVQEKVVALGKEINNLPALAKVGCWDKAQSLLSIKVWLEKPIAENVKELTQACSEKKPTN
jgi:hypothetical protein